MIDESSNFRIMDWTNRATTQTMILLQNLPRKTTAAGRPTIWHPSSPTWVPTLALHLSVHSKGSIWIPYIPQRFDSIAPSARKSEQWPSRAGLNHKRVCYRVCFNLSLLLIIQFRIWKNKQYFTKRCHVCLGFDKYDNCIKIKQWNWIQY